MTIDTKLEIVTKHFEWINGQQYVAVPFVAQYFKMTKKDANEIIRNNEKLFRTLYFVKEEQNEFTGVTPLNSETTPNQKHAGGRPSKTYYLSRDGLLMFVNQLSYSRYDDEREELIVMLKRWLVITGGRVMDGELIESNKLVSGKVDSLEQEIIAMRETHEKLISSTTINSRQATAIKLFIHEKAQRELGAPRSTYYKEHAKKFFANLYIAIGKEFGVTTYKDLNPLDYENIFSFITDWEYHISEEKSYQTTL